MIGADIIPINIFGASWNVLSWCAWIIMLLYWVFKVIFLPRKIAFFWRALWMASLIAMSHFMLQGMASIETYLIDQVAVNNVSNVIGP